MQPHAQNQDGPERLTYTVPEAAALLGISRALGYEAVRRGEIPSVCIGRRLLVPRAALEQFLQNTHASFTNEEAERNRNAAA